MKDFNRNKCLDTSNKKKRRNNERKKDKIAPFCNVWLFRFYIMANGDAFFLFFLNFFFFFCRTQRPLLGVNGKMNP